MPIVVKKKKGETKSDLINRFYHLFTNEGILEEIWKRLEYIKKSQRRYEKKKSMKKTKRKSN